MSFCTHLPSYLESILGIRSFVLVSFCVRSLVLSSSSFDNAYHNAINQTVKVLSIQLPVRSVFYFQKKH